MYKRQGYNIGSQYFLNKVLNPEFTSFDFAIYSTSNYTVLQTEQAIAITIYPDGTYVSFKGYINYIMTSSTLETVSDPTPTEPTPTTITWKKLIVTESLSDDVKLEAYMKIEEPAGVVTAVYEIINFVADFNANLLEAVIEGSVYDNAWTISSSSPDGTGVAISNTSNYQSAGEGGFLTLVSANDAQNPDLGSITFNDGQTPIQVSYPLETVSINQPVNVLLKPNTQVSFRMLPGASTPLSYFYAFASSPTNRTAIVSGDSINISSLNSGDIYSVHIYALITEGVSMSGTQSNQMVVLQISNVDLNPNGIITFNSTTIPTVPPLGDGVMSLINQVQKTYIVRSSSNSNTPQVTDLPIISGTPILSSHWTAGSAVSVEVYYRLDGVQFGQSSSNTVTVPAVQPPSLVSVSPSDGQVAIQFTMTDKTVTRFRIQEVINRNAFNPANSLNSDLIKWYSFTYSNNPFFLTGYFLVQQTTTLSQCLVKKLFISTNTSTQAGFLSGLNLLEDVLQPPNTLSYELGINDNRVTITGTSIQFSRNGTAMQHLIIADDWSPFFTVSEVTDVTQINQVILDKATLRQTTDTDDTAVFVVDNLVNYEVKYFCVQSVRTPTQVSEPVIVKIFSYAPPMLGVSDLKALDKTNTELLQLGFTPAEIGSESSISVTSVLQDVLQDQTVSLADLTDYGFEKNDIRRNAPNIPVSEFLALGFLAEDLVPSQPSILSFQQSAANTFQLSFSLPDDGVPTTSVTVKRGSNVLKTFQLSEATETTDPTGEAGYKTYAIEFVVA